MSFKPFTAPSPYNIDRWGEGFVSINDQGLLCIQPEQDSEHSIPIVELIDELKAQNLRLPALVRFKSILHTRVNNLVEAFNRVSAELNYQGNYRIVYPIKVNQQRRVVEEIITSQPARDNGQVGLEAGSKPELLAVLAQSLEPGSVIVCNGYKDSAYIQTALLGQSLGYQVFLVVEKLSELPLILEHAQRLGVSPNIGIRARLSSIGKGNWQNTGGEKSKFGLSSHQIVQALEMLKQAGQLNNLTLLHFHLGSQIANIRDIQNGLQECAKIYSQLYQLGAAVSYVDIGGGLGVDYEGTQSRSACSINYQLSDYAFSVVQAFSEEADRHQLPHPNLISESGRAITAHHAVLIADVVARDCAMTKAPDALPATASAATQHLWNDYQALQNTQTKRSLIEIYHDAAQAIEDIHHSFSNGAVDLIEQAEAEQLYLAICQLLVSALSPSHRDHREIIDELNEKLAEKLFVNFSLFQSAPDIWGIDQIFPILPIEGLDRPFKRRAIIQDITCDSDGRVDHYVSHHGIESSLQLPEPPSDGHEHLCFFMLGAYQEILGDMHNLFGDTDSVDVSLDSEGRLILSDAILGDTVAEVLNYVNLESEQLMENYRKQLSKQGLDEAHYEAHIQAFAEGLASYTYLDQT